MLQFLMLLNHHVLNQVSKMEVRDEGRTAYLDICDAKIEAYSMTKGIKYTKTLRIMVHKSRYTGKICIRHR
jgi:hypothetical protein